MTHLMLRPDWPATFRRTVRDEGGQPLEVLEFQHLMPVELDDRQLAAVKADIGKSLLLVQLTPDGYATSKPDLAATKAFVEALSADDLATAPPRAKPKKRRSENLAEA